MTLANILIIVTMFQIFICCFLLNFVIVMPFCKAYSPCFDKEYRQVHQSNLYKLIRNGDHLMFVSMKKFFNTLMNIMQLYLILYVEMSNTEVTESLHRVSIIGCSDPLVNESILNIYYAILFMH